MTLHRALVVVDAQHLLGCLLVLTPSLLVRTTDTATPTTHRTERPQLAPQEDQVVDDATSHTAGLRPMALDQCIRTRVGALATASIWLVARQVSILTDYIVSSNIRPLITRLLSMIRRSPFLRRRLPVAHPSVVTSVTRWARP